MKKAVFFDLYGTLIDIRTDEYDPWIYSVLSQYLSYHQIKIEPDALKSAYFGGIEQRRKQSQEVFPEEDVSEVFHEILHKYANRKYPQSVVTDTAMLFRSLTRRQFGVFASLYDVLSRLREEYKIAIISDAQWVFSEPEMAMLGLDQYFKVRILSSRFGFKKPDPRLFEIASARVRAVPEESVYIGDNPAKDLVGAKKAGMKCILFRSERLNHNDYLADGCFYHYSELENVLHEIL